MRCHGCILVVEDDADLGETLREHLAGLGCSVVLAHDGLDALQRLDHEVPAPLCFVLTDLNMPRLDGAGLVDRIRASAHAATPIVTMTAEPQGARPAMVEAHLNKPFAFTEFSPTVARLCRGGPARFRGVGLTEPEGP